jgi:hypothetical protein
VPLTRTLQLDRILKAAKAVVRTVYSARHLTHLIKSLQHLITMVPLNQSLLQPHMIVKPKSSWFVTLDAFWSWLLIHNSTKAVAIIGIQVQILTTNNITTITHNLLSFGIILQLLAIFLSICFIQFRQINGTHASSTRLVRLLVHVPTILILLGIVGLGSAVVVETVETSLCTAIAMSIFLACGVGVCILAFLRG